MTDSSTVPHYAAIVTPFDDAGKVDEKSLRRLCEDIATMPGIAGIVANANAGEVDALTHDERRLVVRSVVATAREVGLEAVAGLAPSPSSFRGAAENAVDFRDDGADKLLVLGPTAFGRGIAQDAYLVGDYASSTFAASELRIIYFLAGPLSGIDYTPDTVRSLCEAEGVVGIKDTMWSVDGFKTTISIVQEENPAIKVLTGNDNCVLGTMRAGAAGSLLVLSCLVGSEIVEMHRAVSQGDTARAGRINAQISPLVDLLFRPPMLRMASRMKAALKLRGLLADATTRLPVPALKTAELSEIEAAMHCIGRV